MHRNDGVKRSGGVIRAEDGDVRGKEEAGGGNNRGNGLM